MVGCSHIGADVQEQHYREREREKVIISINMQKSHETLDCICMYILDHIHVPTCAWFCMHFFLKYAYTHTRT